MRVVILAAGVGSRLRPLTLKKPKALVRVNGATLLEHQINAYLAAGLDQKDIYVVVGYFSNLICLCLEQKYPQVNIVINSEYEVTNNMYSLYLAFKKINFLNNEALIVSNGDCIYDPGIVKELFVARAECAIAVQRGAYLEESMKIKCENHKINHISKKVSQKESFGVSIDLYKLSGAAREKLGEIIDAYISLKKEKNLWTEVAINDLLAFAHFEPHDIGHRHWVEIDNFEDLSLADQLFCNLQIDSKKCFVLDMDGTVYVGNQPVQPTVDYLKSQMANGVEVYFMTNNTSRLPVDYKQKLNGMGLLVDEEHIITPLKALTEHIKGQNWSRCYCLANSKVTAYLERQVTGLKCVTEAEECEALITTYDTELTYEKIKAACLLLQQKPYTPYLATHPDLVCPHEQGFIPDIGCIHLMIEKVTGRKPDLIFGKPNVSLLGDILKKYSKNEVVVVGDRLYTDRFLAQNAGCDFICVLTGETKRIDIDELEMNDSPFLVLEDLGALKKTSIKRV